MQEKKVVFVIKFSVVKKTVSRFLNRISLQSIIVFFYLSILCWAINSFWLWLVLFPVYWQIWFKKDIVKEWW